MPISKRFHFREIGSAGLSVFVEETGHQLGWAGGEIGFKDYALAARFHRLFEGLSGDIEFGFHGDHGFVGFLGKLPQGDAIASGFLDLDHPRAGDSGEFFDRVEMPGRVSVGHAPILRAKDGRVVVGIADVDANGSEARGNLLPEGVVERAEFRDDFRMLCCDVLALSRIGLNVEESFLA